MQDLYPLRLKPIVKAKVWGGRNLETVLGKTLPADELVGEMWEAWDGCAVENGAYAGQKLSDLIARDPRAILGSAGAGQGLPLLFKFIDAQEDLSVQVHPDDHEARELEHQPRGKTEAWHILAAEPNARLILGFNQDVTPARVESAIANKSATALLAQVPVHPGDTLFVPAGTVHAIGKGIVLAEIQQNSDITYRLYDWGRDPKERPLHIAQSLRVLDFARLTDPKIPPLVIKGDAFDRYYLVACRYFLLERLDLKARSTFDVKDKFHILTIIEGQARVGNVLAQRGQTFVVPAGMEAYPLEPNGGRAQVLRMFVADLRLDIIDPLAKAGYELARIARLGGPVPEHNDLHAILESTPGV